MRSGARITRSTSTARAARCSVLRHKAGHRGLGRPCPGSRDPGGFPILRVIRISIPGEFSRSDTYERSSACVCTGLASLVLGRRGQRRRWCWVVFSGCGPAQRASRPNRPRTRACVISVIPGPAQPLTASGCTRRVLCSGRAGAVAIAHAGSDYGGATEVSGPAAEPTGQLEAVAHVEAEEHDVRGPRGELERLHRIEAGIELGGSRLGG